MHSVNHSVTHMGAPSLLQVEENFKQVIMHFWQSSSSFALQMKDNPTLSNFFQRMSYSSFQTLADAYLEKEVSPTHNPPTVLPTAPELVKLAFTYDFTAKIARLSKQNVGHITGLGNRYLQDRFEYKQVRTVLFTKSLQRVSLLSELPG